MLNWFRKKDPVIVENKRYFSRFEDEKSLKEYSFVVFDTELTGLDRRKGEIISIGAIRVKNLQIELGETFYAYVRPGNITHTEATLVHRITPEQLESAPLFEDVIPRFVEFLGKSVIVGHYIDIDMEFLDKACKRLYGGILSNPTIDTKLLARGYQRKLYGRYHDQSSLKGGYNLQELSSKFQLPEFEAHDALEDAMQTAYLFLFLVKKLRSENLDSLRDLYRVGKANTWSNEIY